MSKNNEKKERRTFIDGHVQAGIRLAVLMHEMGHADDIARGINYDHQALSLDLVGAEVYAHQFVCTHAGRNTYRLLLD
jgi:hypothetical protein